MKIPKLCQNGDGRAFSIYPKSGGRREYFGIYGTPEATRKHKEWVIRLLNSDGLLLQEKKQTEYYVSELVSLYVDFIKPKLSNNKFQVLWKNLFRLMNLCGSEQAINIGPRTLIQYQQYMSKEEYKIGRIQRRYKRVTINKAVQDIKEFVKWCCKFEYLPAEHHLKLEAVGNLEIGEYSVEESTPVPPVPFDIILQTLPYLNIPIRVMVQVQYYCGMRPGEVCKLNWNEIDKTVDPEIWLYIPVDHKTKHRNWKLMKAIPPIAQELLLSDERFTRGEYVFDPRIDGRRNKKNGKPHYSVEGYSGAIIRGVKKANKEGKQIEPWTPNQIRHTIATDIRERFGMEHSNDYLGHATVNSTEIYALRTQRRVIELARMLETELFAVGDENGGSEPENGSNEKEME